MLKKKSTSRTMMALLLGAVLVGQPLLLGKAFAASQIGVDFTAAAPLTYDHDVGGGAYDNRIVGRDKDIVESLEGGDFSCGDVVTYLSQIRVDSSVTGNHAITIGYEWTADSTGQSGVAFDQIVSASINSGVIDGGVGDGLGGHDAGNSDTAPLSTNPQVTQNLTQQLFTQGATRSALIVVNNLNGGDKVVLRFDLLLACDNNPNTRPTGNLNVKLVSITSDSSAITGANAGKQTISLKNLDEIKCDPKDPTCQPPPK